MEEQLPLFPWMCTIGLCDFRSGLGTWSMVLLWSTLSSYQKPQSPPTRAQCKIKSIPTTCRLCSHGFTYQEWKWSHAICCPFLAALSHSLYPGPSRNFPWTSWTCLWWPFWSYLQTFWSRSLHLQPFWSSLPLKPFWSYSLFTFLTWLPTLLHKLTGPIRLELPDINGSRVPIPRTIRRVVLAGAAF